MVAGQTYAVAVTMKNTGSNSWTAAAGYKLGSQNPADTARWGINRVALPSSVAPNGQVTFSFNVTAPSTANTYNFQWQMVQDGAQQWFGSATPNVAVTVTGPSGTISTSPSSCTIPSGQSACTTQVAWSSSNAATACVWKTSPAPVQMWQCAPSGSSAWPWVFAGTNSFELRAHATTPSGTDSERLAATLLGSTTATGNPAVVSYTYDQFAPYLARTKGFDSSGSPRWFTSPTVVNSKRTIIDVTWGDHVEQHEIRKDCSDGKSYVWVSAFKDRLGVHPDYPLTANTVLLKKNGVTTNLTNVCGTDGHVYALYNVDSTPYTIEVWGNVSPAPGAPPNQTFYWQANYSYIASSTNTCWIKDSQISRPVIRQEEAWWAGGVWDGSTFVGRGWKDGASGPIGANDQPTGQNVMLSTYFEIAKDAGFLWKWGNHPNSTMTFGPDCLSDISAW